MDSIQLVRCCPRVRLVARPRPPRRACHILRNEQSFANDSRNVARLTLNPMDGIRKVLHSDAVTAMVGPRLVSAEDLPAVER